MSEPKEASRAQQLMGDFAPKLAELTDGVLFGDVWARAELSPRDRSLITVTQENERYIKSYFRYLLGG